MTGDDTTTMTGPQLFDHVFDGTATVEGYESWTDLTGNDFFSEFSFGKFCGEHYPSMSETTRAVLWTRYVQDGFAVQQSDGRWKRVAPCA